MMIHRLKLDVRWFESVVRGDKTFEIRKNDRGFKVGDCLILKEVETDSDGSTSYTGNEIVAKITSILTADDFPAGLKEGYVILSIRIDWLE